ncbi:MAG: hypothetical protein ACRDQW_02090 [Haloechinothrix sp.]
MAGTTGRAPRKTRRPKRTYPQLLRGPRIEHGLAARRPRRSWEKDLLGYGILAAAALVAVANLVTHLGLLRLTSGIFYHLGYVIAGALALAGFMLLGRDTRRG